MPLNKYISAKLILNANKIKPPSWSASDVYAEMERQGYVLVGGVWAEKPGKGMSNDSFTTSAAHDFWVTLEGAPGEAVCGAIGTATLPVKSGLPIEVDLIDVGKQPCFMLDIDALDPDKFFGLIQLLADHYHESDFAVEQQISQHGLPIRADLCEFHSAHTLAEA